MLALMQRALRAADRREEVTRARHAGMIVGDDTRFVGSQDFGSEPFLIRIGRECLITDGVRFITHDGGIQVPYIRAGKPAKDVYGRKSTFGSIIIGDGCFIGTGAIILAGTEIGDHSIVGAGSVVKGSFGGGSVIAGMPARAVGTVDDYFAKNEPRVVTFDGSESQRRRAAIIRESGTGTDAG